MPGGGLTIISAMAGNITGKSQKGRQTPDMTEAEARSTSKSCSGQADVAKVEARERAKNKWGK